MYNDTSLYGQTEPRGQGVTLVTYTVIYGLNSVTKFTKEVSAMTVTFTPEIGAN